MVLIPSTLPSHPRLRGSDVHDAGARPQSGLQALFRPAPHSQSLPPSHSPRAPVVRSWPRFALGFPVHPGAFLLPPRCFHAPWHCAFLRGPALPTHGDSAMKSSQTYFVQALLATFKAWAVGRGPSHLVLDVNCTSKSALRLYSNFGFKAYGNPEPLGPGSEELVQPMRLEV